MSQENQLWEQAPKPFSIATASKKSFSSPAVLYAEALRYFVWCDSNPFYRVEQLKKPTAPIPLPDGRIVPGETLIEIPVKRPYSETALTVFLGVNKRYFDKFKFMRRPGGELAHVEGNDAWLDVIDFIEQTIRTQQIDGTQSGFFNPMITARVLGLVDKQEVKQETTTIKEYIKIGDQTFEV